MRFTPPRVTLSLLIVLSTACRSSTGLDGCNLPAETASVTPFSPPVAGVVHSIRIGGIGQTPEGYDPWAQVNALVTIPLNNGSTHVTVDIVMGKGIPVLLQQKGGTLTPTSACHLRTGDRVTVWAPLQGVTDGGFVGPLGDTTRLEDASFLAEKLIIETGN